MKWVERSVPRSSSIFDNVFSSLVEPQIKDLKRDPVCDCAEFVVYFETMYFNPKMKTSTMSYFPTVYDAAGAYY